MVAGEQKKFGLKAARKLSMTDGLLNLVMVYEGDTISCGYVSFTKDLIVAIGKHLPRGVSYADPAFLIVFFNKVKAAWQVIARYVERPESSILWSSGSKPTWLSEVRILTRLNNENDSQSRTQRARSHALAV